LSKAKAKRTGLPRQSDVTKAFQKDWESLSRSGRFDMKKLKEVMLLLIANDAPLEPQWKDHELIGNWSGFRECHIGGDFLLMYKLHKTPKLETIVFTRTGTHSQLFS
jgi:mRNA interferase YafQ